MPLNHPIQKQLQKLNGLTLFKYFITLILLFLPLMGVYQAVLGLINGPNYFGVRQVVLETVDTYHYTSSSGGRFGQASQQKGIFIAYSFTAEDGTRQSGDMTFSMNNLPVPQYRLQQGESLHLRVPVAKTEGSFGINRAVEQGLAIGGFFGLLAWPILLLIHSNGNNKRKHTALKIVKGIYLLIVLYLIYVVVR